jgi:hypothetical protein
MAVPLGGAMLVPGLVGAPMGMGGPLGMVAPVAGMGAMQLAPGWLSFQHQAPQLLTNPYMGGPFSQLPILQGHYGLMPFSQPTVPFYSGLPSGAWAGGALPVLPVNPYLTPAAPTGPTGAFNPLEMLKQGSVVAPAPAATAPASVPFLGPWAVAPQVPPQPVAPVSSQRQDTSPDKSPTPFDPAYWLTPLKNQGITPQQ